MLWHVIQRVKRARMVDRVVVATSTAPADDAIENMCQENGVPCYRGSENDVLDRFYHAALAEKPAKVVRITADCPLIDPEVIDRVVRRFERGDLDYASNAMVRSYPDGLDTEVFSFSVLERAWHEANKASEREHVTPTCVRKNSGRPMSRTIRRPCTSIIAGRWMRWRIWNSFGPCTRLFAIGRRLE